ncbi:hypothetical protein ACVGVM_07655 [Pseudonocardia bannensis]|uniref:Uncharacterized protein n=1 Tax=Pseudonocardia bannensis TaxID=630973 RepID=A0A848DRV1_9PSEU|nr:hypothetical protein [Pseudonocardia bannensis]NMH95146.1 hypothetical protein [Pseudonocardia bannensis]
MASSARSRPRWPLHPLTAALVLLGGGLFAAMSALTAQRDLATAASGLLLVAVAGAAAGFANSGST